MPHSRPLGLLVNSTTIITGTKKIRRTVREFGRFIVGRAGRPLSVPFGPTSATIDSAQGCVNVLRIHMLPGDGQYLAITNSFRLASTLQLPIHKPVLQNL